MVRFQFPGEREESAVAVVDGSPVGWARVFFPERDNLDKCWSHLEVDPQHRRQGVGSALVEWMEQQARAAAATCSSPRSSCRSATVSRTPTASSPCAGALPCRASRSCARSRCRSRPMSWPTTERRAAEAMGELYELTVHVDGVPAELRQGVCDASNRLILDAPTGDVEFEPESMTVDDYETLLQHLRDTGRTMVTAVAVHRESGVVAAYTDLAVPSGDPHVVFQWGTLVLPEHRGHRLGMAVKVANLKELARLAPERRSVQTMNDEQNPWMVQINKDLGFAIIEEALTMKKAF